VKTIPWSDGFWTNDPANTVIASDGLHVTAREGSDALTVRARADDEPFRLVRVAPLDAGAVAFAGPFCCAPSRDDLTVRFTSWTSSAADASLHPE
jgi:regulation of enolase protein 1 (concanavalin A-like superfamily)